MRVYRLAAVACVLGVASAAHADARNVISRITVTDAGGGATVRITGSRAPSFTQFTLRSPQRVVIDLSGAVLAGPAAQIPGDGHLVRDIRTAMFESRAVSVARVTLEFAHPVTYRMHADGTDLVVALHGGAAAAAVADAAPPPSAPSTGAAPQTAAAEAARARAERQAAQAAAALKTARAALAKADADRKAAEAKAAAESRQAAQAEAARKQALAKLEAGRTAAATRRAHDTQAETALAKARAAEAAAEAKATAEARARAQAEAKAAAAEKQAAAARAEVARLRAQGPVVADAKVGVEPGERYALADIQAGGPEEGAGPAVAPGAPKIMEMVGFRQKAKVSQVFIKTNEPARYSVNQSDDAVIVDVENTQARTENDLNYLDTRFFDSAVARIDPQEIEGAGTHIRIRIELKEKVPFEVKQVDNEIEIDFQRPAS